MTVHSTNLILSNNCLSIFILMLYFVLCFMLILQVPALTRVFGADCTIDNTVSERRWPPIPSA